MNTDSAPSLPPPSKWLLLLEGRAPSEFLRLLLAWPQLGKLPRGDGHPVMVVPGFGAGDTSTAPLRALLARLGYASYGWEMGRNLGMRASIKDGLRNRLVKLHARHEAKVSLIGWSLGGVFVREMARGQPERVRRVFTLGSPINGHPAANNMMPLFALANRGKPVNLDLEGFRRRIAPPPVPCCAIYTRTDGIVSWPCCLEPEAPNTENVEVRGSHMGLAVNSHVVRALAERLARP
jgi:pimeloyl-ACP methyl ester carboxylesterase